MSKASPIKARIRAKAGTREAKKARKEGYIPAVVYGHKKENLMVSVPKKEFFSLLTHGVHLLELQMDEGKSETVLIKDVQYDYLGTNLVHIDFSRVNLDERVPVNVPVVLRGTPAGVQAGGVLQQLQMDVELECLVTDIPEQLKASVIHLEIGQALHAGDLELPPGAKLLTDPDVVIAQVTEPVEEAEEQAEEGLAEAAEPEVIGKGKEASEEEQQEES